MTDGCRALTQMILAETIAAGLPPDAVFRAKYLCSRMPGAPARSARVQWILHSVIKSWAAEGSLKDPDFVAEAVRQTRKSLKHTAGTFKVRNTCLAALTSADL